MYVRACGPLYEQSLLCWGHWLLAASPRPRRRVTGAATVIHPLPALRPRTRPVPATAAKGGPVAARLQHPLHRPPPRSRVLARQQPAPLGRFAWRNVTAGLCRLSGTGGCRGGKAVTTHRTTRRSPRQEGAEQPAKGLHMEGRGWSLAQGGKLRHDCGLGCSGTRGPRAAEPKARHKPSPQGSLRERLDGAERSAQELSLSPRRSRPSVRPSPGREPRSAPSLPADASLAPAAHPPSSAASGEPATAAGPSLHPRHEGPPARRHVLPPRQAAPRSESPPHPALRGPPPFLLIPLLPPLPRDPLQPPSLGARPCPFLATRPRDPVLRHPPPPRTPVAPALLRPLRPSPAPSSSRSPEPSSASRSSSSALRLPPQAGPARCFPPHIVLPGSRGGAQGSPALPD